MLPIPEEFSPPPTDRQRGRGLAGERARRERGEGLNHPPSFQASTGTPLRHPSPTISCSPALPAAVHVQAPWPQLPLPSLPSLRPQLSQRLIRLMKRHTPECRSRVSAPRAPRALLCLPPLPLWCSSPAPLPGPPLPTLVLALTLRLQGPRVQIGWPDSGPRDGGPVRGWADMGDTWLEGEKESSCIDHVI